MPQSLPDRLVQSWTTNASAWTQAVREGTIPSRADGTDTAIIEAIVRGLPPGGRVLDVGCGEGWLCRALAAVGAETHGVDGSAPLIEAATREGGSFDVIAYHEAEQDPGRLGGPYDVIAFNFALLSDAVVGILRAARQQLAPGGRVLIQTLHPVAAGGPYVDGWREESFGTIEGTFEPMPWYFRTFGSWVRVLTSAGLTILEVAEPTHPVSGDPLSMILTAEAPVEVWDV